MSQEEYAFLFAFGVIVVFGFLHMIRHFFESRKTWTIEKMSKNITDLKEENTKLYRILHKERDTAQEDLKRYQVDCQSLREKIDDSESVRRTQLSQIDSMLAQLSKFDDIEKALTEERRIQVETCDEFDALQDRHNRLESEYDQLKKDLHDRTNERESWHSEALLMRSQRDAANERMGFYQRKSAEFRQRYRRVMRENADLKNKSEVINQAMTNTFGDLKRYQSHADRIESELRRLLNDAEAFAALRQTKPVDPKSKQSETMVGVSDTGERFEAKIDAKQSLAQKVKADYDAKVKDLWDRPNFQSIDGGTDQPDDAYPRIDQWYQLRDLVLRNAADGKTLRGPNPGDLFIRISMNDVGFPIRLEKANFYPVDRKLLETYKDGASYEISYLTVDEVAEMIQLDHLTIVSDDHPETAPDELL